MSSEWRDQVKGWLKNNHCVVTFIKKNGEERIMKCTLDEDVLPEPSISENRREKAPNETTLAVWDLDKNSWRSFRLDSIVDIVVPYTPEDITEIGINWVKGPKYEDRT